MLTDEQISHMADRFCGWPIPENWNPDGGVSYERFGNKGTPREYKHYTSGTNLFSKQQAEEMIRYMIDGMQSTRKPPDGMTLRAEPEKLDSPIAAFDRLMNKMPLKEDGSWKCVDDFKDYTTVYMAIGSRTPPPPIDTINIKREVLQGVREAMKNIASHDAPIDIVDVLSKSEREMVEAAHTALASLDAVLNGDK